MADAPAPAAGGPRARSRRVRRRLLTGLLVVLLLLAVDGVYVVLALQSNLQEAADRLTAADDGLGDARLRDAEKELTDALLAAGHAAGLTDRPSFEIAQRVPGARDDAGAVEILADVAELSAEAGLNAIDAARDAGALKGDVAAAVYRDGQVRLDALSSALPAVTEARDLLARATRLLAGAPDPALAPVTDALGVARDRVEAAFATADRATTLLRALPGLLGRDATRTYLLAFLTPSEARGSGGVMGFYGILETSDGRVELTTVSPVVRLTAYPFGSVEPPVPWFAKRYATAYGLRQFQQANATPNFPVAAEVWLRMYERVIGDRLDGVMAMDPIALAELTKATGPLRGRGIDAPIGPDNAARVILHDSYLAFGRNESAQERFLGDLIEDFWNKLNGPAVDEPALVRAVAEAVRTKHLKVYSRDGGDQRALEELRADGGYEGLGPNIQLVFNNNAVPSKVDYFLRRTIDTEVRVAQDGEALVTTKVTLRNTAPDGPPSLLLGPNIGGDPENLRNDTAGMNRMFLDILLPQRAHYEDYRFNGRSKLAPRDFEAGHPVVWRLLTIPPGETTTIEVVYSSRHLVDLGSDGGTFDFTFVPQTTAFPDRYSFTLVPPLGYEVVEDDAAPVPLFETRGTLETDVELDLTFVPED
ncbi:MAG TPA: DUF4012 domain-containing protein [Actinomycetota bacterium]|nr:DUF4012 domain-containing protein [Actinomycetota bacterium]